MDSKNRQKNRPFQLKIKDRRGGNSLDNSRDGFSGGAQRGLARAGAGASLALRAKIGSSFGIQSHQIGTKRGIFAQWGDFFVGFAERKPNVFLGGMKKLPRYK